jgi:3-hydroxyacyl-CoA dehydrogenase/enoyl-CoA hydratase/3-hydroxybutyryl-CoA epimerase/3-hydroxyacyl-CoA dehydrogenase/enoyl-CoA hydratase/3-hydroxybutyryl-CoA epimerase/enoyl-CoA isomerase
MELVEVIRGEQTSDETVATLVALAKQLRKTPIVVRDCPGFLVNRVLFPYMSESLRLLREGASMDAIDGAAMRFGMPMGPIALFDLVGLDTAHLITKVMVAAHPDQVEFNPLLTELVETLGRRGKKSGAGFRKYGGKGSRPEPDPALEPVLERQRVGHRVPDETEIVDRLFLPMLLEATRVLEEGIVREPADVDIGLILGIGFPAFRGGLLRWADSQGAEALMKRLSRYEPLGWRFEPTETLRQMVWSGKLFYPRPAPAVPEGKRVPASVVA